MIQTTLTPIRVRNTHVFFFGQVVYLRTDEEQRPRMITHYKTDIHGGDFYGLSCGVDFSWHFPEEISTTKNFTL